MLAKLKYWYIKKIYADHNDAKIVRETLHHFLAASPASALGLNIGAGKTKIDPRVKNLEIEAGEGIDIVGSVENIPCPDGHFDFVLTQEVLEHVPSPDRAMKEIHRVLKTDGRVYIQLPFVIGYHPCPNDYWRFTHEGMAQLAGANGFKVVQSGLSVGPAVGFYRIAVEFFAVLASALFRKLYKPTKLVFSLVLYPIKWLDPLMRRSLQANRIAGGYFIVCEKVA
jgi:SAM-dependent methyltransferase